MQGLVLFWMLRIMTGLCGDVCGGIWCETLSSIKLVRFFFFCGYGGWVWEVKFF